MPISVDLSYAWVHVLLNRLRHRYVIQRISFSALSQILLNLPGSSTILWLLILIWSVLLVARSEFCSVFLV